MNEDNWGDDNDDWVDFTGAPPPLSTVLDQLENNDVSTSETDPMEKMNKKEPVDFSQAAEFSSNKNEIDPTTAETDNFQGFSGSSSTETSVAEVNMTKGGQSVVEVQRFSSSTEIREVDDDPFHGLDSQTNDGEQEGGDYLLNNNNSGTMVEAKIVSEHISPSEGSLKEKKLSIDDKESEEVGEEAITIRDNENRNSDLRDFFISTSVVASSSILMDQDSTPETLLPHPDTKEQLDESSLEVNNKHERVDRSPESKEESRTIVDLSNQKPPESDEPKSSLKSLVADGRVVGGSSLSCSMIEEKQPQRFEKREECHRKENYNASFLLEPRPDHGTRETSPIKENPNSSPVPHTMAARTKTEPETDETSETAESTAVGEETDNLEEVNGKENGMNKRGLQLYDITDVNDEKLNQSDSIDAPSSNPEFTSEWESQQSAGSADPVKGQERLQSVEQAENSLNELVSAGDDEVADLVKETSAEHQKLEDDEAEEIIAREQVNVETDVETDECGDDWNDFEGSPVPPTVRLSPSASPPIVHSDRSASEGEEGEDLLPITSDEAGILRPLIEEGDARDELPEKEVGEIDSQRQKLSSGDNVEVVDNAEDYNREEDDWEGFESAVPLNSMATDSSPSQSGAEMSHEKSEFPPELDATYISSSLEGQKEGQIQRESADGDEFGLEGNNDGGDEGDDDDDWNAFEGPSVLESTSSTEVNPVSVQQQPPPTTASSLSAAVENSFDFDADFGDFEEGTSLSFIPSSSPAVAPAVVASASVFIAAFEDKDKRFVNDWYGVEGIEGIKHLLSIVEENLHLSKVRWFVCWCTLDFCFLSAFVCY
jgi:hypothetical protein